MFSLESPLRGDSKEYTKYTIFNIKKKITLNYHKSAAMGFFQGAQARVRNSCGIRAISVRATEVLLYIMTAYLLDVVPCRETKFGYSLSMSKWPSEQYEVCF